MKGLHFVNAKSQSLISTGAASAFAASCLYLGGYQVIPLYVSSALLLALLIYGINNTDGTRAARRPYSFSAIMLAIFAAYCLATYQLSLLPNLSLLAAWVFMAMPLAYFATTVALRDERAWRYSLKLIQIVALGIMALGIVEFVLIRSRPFSIFLDFNVLAAFCNVFALPAIARLHDRVRADGFAVALRSRTAWFLCAASLCLAATASRGGHLSFLLGVAVLGVLLIRHDRRAWKTVAASLAIFVASLMLIVPFQHHASSLSRLTGITNDQSTQDRLEILRSTWRMVEDGPWYGSGLGTYKVRYLMFRSPGDSSSSGDLAHNDYLQVLAEGGPVLLGTLLLLAFGGVLAARRLWRSARNTAASPTFVEAAGLVGGLSCLFAHAAVNFIFYAMPLAMITGLYFGRLDNLRTDIPASAPRFEATPRSLRLLLSGLMLWLTTTVGLQGFYHVVRTGQCQLLMCQSLTRDENFLARFSALLAATQPSYLPARDWLADAYLATAYGVTDGGKRLEGARQAAKELSDLIRQFPALPTSYARLADLLVAQPEAATAIPVAERETPEALYAEGLRREPMDVQTRIKLATMLDMRGQHEPAFSLLFDDGMRWWKVAAFPDSGRSMLLKAAIPLALKLGRCKDAIEMAQGLNIFLPDDPLAKPIAHLGEREPPVSDGTPGCAAG
ncbi:O-antigen ligase family protein [Nevskia ramosa]|uniref:O-antigen ligase family protein n=1 Tax=Nevskia ramosa TaxID=64002 RepID=UPI0003B3E773|nr:O-antigen ligase family protein [Nevskia ramosa]